METRDFRIRKSFLIPLGLDTVLLLILTGVSFFPPAPPMSGQLLPLLRW